MKVNGRSDLYVLDGQTPVPCDDLFKWAAWFETADRRIARTEFASATVSTVFLGVDHNMLGRGPPLLFETMVFGELFSCEPQWRTATWNEAMVAHDNAVQMVKLKLQGAHPMEMYKECGSI